MISPAPRHGPSVSADQLGRLSPLDQLDSASLETIVPEVEIIRIQTGYWDTQAHAANLLYLVAGSLRFANAGDDIDALQPSMPAARQPLPITPDTIVTAVEPAIVIAIPEWVIPAMDTPAAASMDMAGDQSEDALLIELRQALTDGKQDLPSMPDLGIRIGRAIDDPETDSGDIAGLIQLDPALTAQLMRLVNSAAHGARQQIQSIPQAVTRLGRQAVRNLVFSCLIKGLFRSDSPLLTARMQALWCHSCHVGAVAMLLARRVDGLDPNRALLAGLVHDIGVLSILSAARAFPRLADNARLLDAASSRLRTEIGVLTLQAWGFEQDLIDAAQHAEAWLHDAGDAPEYADVVRLAQLYTQMTQQAPGDLFPPLHELPAARKLGLDALDDTQVAGLLEEAEQEISRVQGLLENS